MTEQKQATGQAKAVAITPEKALAAYAGMIMAIPEAPESDGSEIIAAILMATSIDELQGTSKLPAGKELVGKTLRIDGITRFQSDIEGGLGHYLVVDATDTGSGEVIKWQTSAGALMATLVKLHFSDAFPAIVEITSSTTRSGMVAVNAIVHGASNPLRALGT